jgi:hypothetical protein
MRLDASRNDIDHLDSERLEFYSQLVAEKVDGCFGRVVISLPRYWEFPGYGTDVDDRSFGGD